MYCISVKTGVFPDDIKVAEVIPIFEQAVKGIVLTTDQSHYFPHSVKFLKNCLQTCLPLSFKI